MMVMKFYLKSEDQMMKNGRSLAVKLKIMNLSCRHYYREIKEETGQDVSVYEFFGIFSEPGRIIEYLNGGVKQVVTIAFKVKLSDNNVKCSDESKSIRFRDINEMSEDKFVETHIPILRAVKENKKMHID
jgi:ADP-ribose pyrophosphatase YjhB (NUDIX family)